MLGDFFGVLLDESGELGDSRLPDFPLRRLSTVQYLIELIQLLGKNQYLLLFLTGHCLRLLLSCFQLALTDNHSLLRSCNRLIVEWQLVGLFFPEAVEHSSWQGSHNFACSVGIKQSEDQYFGFVSDLVGSFVGEGY
jgi:hypothetical protein